MTAETLWWRLQYAKSLGDVFELAREQAHLAGGRGMSGADVTAWLADIARWEAEGDKTAAEDAVWNLDGWSMTGEPRPGSAQARPSDALDSALEGYKEAGKESADAAAGALNSLVGAAAKTVWEQPALRAVVIVAGTLAGLGALAWVIGMRRAT